MINSYVIGAGQIAAGYDKPTDDAVLTHLHALSAHPNFHCAGIYDRDPRRLELAAAKWNVPVFDGTREPEKPDLVVICVPDEYHFEVLEQVLTWKPKLVLCEKPLTLSARESVRAVNLYKEAGIPLAVNYQRRVEETVLEARRAFSSGELGRALTAGVKYSKGLLHNGSHALDLLCSFFGNVRAVTCIESKNDFKDADLSLGGTFEFDSVTAYFQPGDERCFSLFEIDLIFEKGRYLWTQSGMRYEKWVPMPDPVFPGYSELKMVESGPTRLDRAFLSVYQHLSEALTSGKPLQISAETLIQSQIAIEQMREMHENSRPGGRKNRFDSSSGESFT